jgi:hypothetical protein
VAWRLKGKSAVDMEAWDGEVDEWKRVYDKLITVPDSRRSNLILVINLFLFLLLLLGQGQNGVTNLRKMGIHKQ